MAEENKKKKEELRIESNGYVGARFTGAPCWIAAEIYGGWYEPRTIYTDAVLTDNTQAFYGLAGANIETLGDMINMQPLL